MPRKSYPDLVEFCRTRHNAARTVQAQSFWLNAMFNFSHLASVLGEGR